MKNSLRDLEYTLTYYFRYVYIKQRSNHIISIKVGCFGKLVDFYATIIGDSTHTTILGKYNIIMCNCLRKDIDVEKT